MSALRVFQQIWWPFCFFSYLCFLNPRLILFLESFNIITCSFAVWLPSFWIKLHLKSQKFLYFQSWETQWTSVIWPGVSGCSNRSGALFFVFFLSLPLKSIVSSYFWDHLTSSPAALLSDSPPYESNFTDRAPLFLFFFLSLLLKSIVSPYFWSHLTSSPAALLSDSPPFESNFT